jgi:methyltransferase (TIGR00027 family)
MRAGPPSVTARAVAVARARLAPTRPVTPAGDPDAEARLDAELGRGARSPEGTMFHHLAARTRFVDQCTMAAIQAGVGQVVIVGAGYDGRALRFQTGGVRFFEVDHPATQADKRRRLERLGTALDHLRLVPADFVSDDVAAALAAAGHDAARASCLLCEGVLLYLDRPVVERLLTALARAAASPGSTLVVSIPLRWRPRPASERAGEPARSVYGRDEALALLRRCGWAPATVVDPADIDPEASRGAALLVEANRE